MGDQLLTTKEVAERLSVSKTTVKRWIADGKLKAYKFGRDYKVEARSVEALISSSRTN